MYFASQQPMAASANAMFINASRRLFSDSGRSRSAESAIAIVLKEYVDVLAAQNRLARVSSAVRVALDANPFDFVSLKSEA
jgi:hypothetical protein